MLFFFHQGSKKSTVYKWDFGEADSEPENMTGFVKASSRTKTFTRRGLHTVTVTASNSAGAAKTSLSFMVEGQLNTGSARVDTSNRS